MAADDSIVAVEGTQLSRTNALGVLDPTFGAGGAATIPSGAVAAAQLADRSVVFTGQDPGGHAAVGHVSASGAIDSSFGNAGVTTFDFMGSSDHVSTLALGPDGSILALGTSTTTASVTGATVIARYAPSGSLDPSFGNQGIVRTSAATAQGLVVDAAGRLLLRKSALELTRFDASGVLDPSFGASGVAKLPAGALMDPIVDAIATDAEGRYLASTGDYFGSGSPSARFNITRVTADGAIDITFGTNGTTMGPEGGNIVLFVQPDERIIAAGYTDNGQQRLGAVARYTAAGVLDASFGVNGLAALPRLPGPGNFTANRVYAVAVQADGALIAVGSAANSGGSSWGPANLFVARLLPNGVLDPTFSGTGQLFTTFGFDSASASAVAIASDGSIWVAGTAGVQGRQRGFVARFTSTGALDPAYGVAFVGPGLTSTLSSALLQPDGRLVAGGSVLMSPTGYDFALLRIAP